tara:strand:- start:463 stop:708 length:246 start_codon:yes stop_codon:yes gene_type:complete
MNITDEGRRKGAEKARANRDSTPDVGPSFTKGAEIFARAMEAAGNRRYDEEGMVVKFKDRTTSQQLELFGPEVDLGTKPKT